MNVEETPIVHSDGTALPGITISIGLVINNAESTCQTLVDDADRQLYQAKQQGRNCIKY
jgi:PleD family two-component response regulator